MTDATVERTCSRCGLVFVEISTVGAAGRAFAGVCPRCRHVADPVELRDQEDDR